MQKNIHSEIHQSILIQRKQVEDWFLSIRPHLQIPFYSSYDIRDAGFKVSSVDANIYPAGFNNICGADRDHAGELASDFIARHYGASFKKILILTEEHTNNPYYWDNVITLQQMMSEGGLQVKLAVPRMKSEKHQMIAASGRTAEVYRAQIVNGEIFIDGFKPDLVVSNNDFSDEYDEWGTEILTPMTPPRELGWYQRRKSTHFKFYNQLATEFAKIIGIDPWFLTVKSELFLDFDTANEESKNKLSERVANLLNEIESEYTKRKIQQKPSLFIKNNAGTYGLAVMQVSSTDEIQNLNYKTRKKMKAAKGGREVNEVIIQEGIPSVVQSDGMTAEPAIYLIGCKSAGGFLRTHSEKGPTESLNSPGAVYKRLCLSDLKISVEGHPLENVYAWVAKLGLLAIGLEAKEMSVKYRNYILGSTCD